MGFNALQSSYVGKTFVYGVIQIIFHVLEVRYEPNFLNFAEFLKPFIVNSSAKNHHLLMDRRKVIRKWKMVTDFQAKLTVYIHPKTLRFWALFRIGRVSHFC